MKSLFIVAGILALCLTVSAVKNHNSMHDGLESNSKLARSIKELQKTKAGKLFFDFAELSMRTTGAVDALVEGIEAFGRQIEDRLKQENDIFNANEADHASKGLELQSLINQAELDINREKKRLNQELLPRSAELDEILVDLKEKKENNKKQNEDAVAVRNEQHEAFVELTNNLTEAVRGIDESLELIDEMEKDGSVVASFLETKSEVRRQFTKVLKQVKTRSEKCGHQYSSFIQALTQMVEDGNFKNRQVFKEMKDNLNDLRGNFQESIQVAYADEENQVSNFEKQLKQLADEEAVFDEQYAQAYIEREDKGVRIRDTETIISTRESDQRAYDARLTLEKITFASNLKIHDDLVAEINEELNVLENILDTVKSPPFAEFLAGKMD